MINLHRCTEQERAGEESVFMTIGYNIVSDAGVPDAAALSIACAMGQMMSAGDRFYHTIVHINDIFRFVGMSKIDLTIAEKVALFFHDAVYVIGKTPESEIQSAKLMRAMLSAYPVKPELLDDAERMILATAKHLEDVQDNSVHRVLDLDLAGLGSRPHEFDSRSKLIGHEVGANNNAKRVEFLNRLLARPKLFYLLTELEAEARGNIKREIQSLS